MHWTLLHPGWWPLLFVGAVPVLVHLISRRRARDVRFAPMEFVLRSQRRTARRIQPRQWLLMAARTLALLLLALAILGPVRRHQQTATAGGNAPPRHALAVDLSASMLATVDGQARYKRAVAQARRMLKALPAEEPAAVVACGRTPLALVEPPGFDRAAGDAALAAMEPALEAADLPACLVRARAALGGAAGPARITLFTDAARHAWDARQKPDVGGATVAVVRPDSTAAVNLGWHRMDVTAAPQAGARGVQVEGQVEAPGTVPQEPEVRATLEVDGEPVAQGTVMLDGAGPWTRRFTHVLPQPGPQAPAMHTLTLRLPPDAWTPDDALMLPVAAPREVRVLVVDGDPQSVAWRDEVFYLERALGQPLRTGGVLHSRIITQPPSPADVDEADVVVLCNVRNIPRETVEPLERFVLRGGGLFITGGERVDVEFYNGALAGLLPQPLRGEKSRVELEGGAAREVLGLGEVDGAHPVFAPFHGQRPEGLSRTQTHTFLLLETGSRAERHVLMRFSNEAPALVERTVGAGRVLLLTTTVDRDWSDLAIRPGFLPLMQQALLYLADALEDPRPRHVGVGQVRTVSPRRGVARVAVRTPSGQQVEVPLAPVNGEAWVSLPPPTEVGIHQVWMAPEGGQLTEVPAERYAAWPPLDEGDLVPLTDEDIAARLPEGTRFLWGDDTGEPPQRPLWPYALLLLQLAMLAEGWLARRG